MAILPPSFTLLRQWVNPTKNRVVLIATVIGVTLCSGAVYAEKSESLLSSLYLSTFKRHFPFNRDEMQHLKENADAITKETYKPLTESISQKRAVALNLQVVETNPVLHTNAGLVSAVIFSDSTGAPWPISGVVNGNPNAYQIDIVGDQTKSNTLSISPKKHHVSTNIMVSLAGHPVPVTMDIVNGEATTDYRLDIQVEGRSPNALPGAPTISLLDVSEDKSMLGFLDGVIPEGAEPLLTTHHGVEGWEYDGNYLMRSKGRLVSPQYDATYRNVTGVYLYVVEPAPVMLFSFNGKIETIDVEGSTF